MMGLVQGCSCRFLPIPFLVWHFALHAHTHTLSLFVACLRLLCSSEGFRQSWGTDHIAE